MKGGRAAVAACAGVIVVGAGASPSAAPAAATRVIGHGTARSCTSSAVVAAVRAGGRITFSCGPKHVTIRLRQTAKVLNSRREVVLDGGGLVTLSGGGRHRILYMDTCDPAQRFTTSHCQDQATPRLVVENLTFADGNSTGQDFDGGGGGAIFARGGGCASSTRPSSRTAASATGPTSAAVRCERCRNTGAPVDVVSSRFTANVCSNGGALSSIGVSWRVAHSRFVGNRAIGVGANPARAGTPGGGSGGAIYNDGNRFRLTITDSQLADNHAREGGGAIFFVSNDRTGTLAIRTAFCSTTAATAFRPRACPASSSWAPGRPRSCAPSCAEARRFRPARAGASRRRGSPRRLRVRP